jgi:hypothetical protein
MVSYTNKTLASDYQHLAPPTAREVSHGHVRHFQIDIFKMLLTWVQWTLQVLITLTSLLYIYIYIFLVEFEKDRREKSNNNVILNNLFYFFFVSILNNYLILKEFDISSIIVDKKNYLGRWIWDNVPSHSPIRVIYINDRNQFVRNFIQLTYKSDMCLFLFFFFLYHWS